MLTFKWYDILFVLSHQKDFKICKYNWKKISVGVYSSVKEITVSVVKIDELEFIGILLMRNYQNIHSCGMLSSKELFTKYANKEGLNVIKIYLKKGDDLS